MYTNILSGGTTTGPEGVSITMVVNGSVGAGSEDVEVLVVVAGDDGGSGTLESGECGEESGRTLFVVGWGDTLLSSESWSSFAGGP